MTVDVSDGIEIFIDPITLSLILQFIFLILGGRGAVYLITEDTRGLLILFGRVTIVGLAAGSDVLRVFFGLFLVIWHI